MKEMKCLNCEKTFRAETSDEMMKVMMPHYMSDHKEMMEGQTEETKAEWMKKFQEEWDKTPEVAEAQESMQADEPVEAEAQEDAETKEDTE